eukprot:gene5236-14077_t
MAWEERRSELGELLCMLDDPAAFRARMVEPFPPWGAPSHPMRRHAGTLLGAGVARVCRRGMLRGMVKLFTVPKSDPLKLRLVVDARPINSRMLPPPRFSLKTPAQLAGFVLGRGFRRAASVDQRAWFYQFPLSNGVERYWGAQLGGGLVVTLAVMAMGWTYAVVIAQWTMELLMVHAIGAGAGVAWVDDGMLLGADDAAVHAHTADFRARNHRVNGQIAEDKSDFTPRARLKQFGFEWDLEADQYWLPAEWRGKAAALVDAMCAVGTADARSVWRCVGVALWAAVGLQRRLHRYAGLLRWVSDGAKEVAASPRGWATPLSLSPAALRDLRSLSAFLLRGELRAGPPPRAPPRFPVVVWSDASEAGGGCVIGAPGGWWAAWWPWLGVHSPYAPSVTDEPIFFLEGRALLRGLRFAVEDLGLASAPILLRCDNLPFVQAAVRGCSSTRLGNELLAQIDHVVCSLPAGVAVEWVSTDVMLADPFSRI